MTSLSDIPQSSELDTPDVALAACTIPDSEPDGSPDNSLLFSKLMSEDGDQQAMLQLLEEEQANKRTAASSSGINPTMQYWSTEDKLPDPSSSQAKLRDASVQGTEVDEDEDDDTNIKCYRCGFFAHRIPIGQQCSVCQQSFCSNHIAQGICAQCAKAKKHYDDVAMPVEEVVKPYNSLRCIVCDGCLELSLIHI